MTLSDPMRKRVALAALVACLGVASGCRALWPFGSGRTTGPEDGSDPAAATELPLADPDVQAATNAPDPTATGPVPRLNPGVRVNVRILVAGKVEVNEAGLSVSDAGELQLPLLNDVSVRDMTLAEAEARLAQLYSHYFRAPQAIVTFVHSGSDQGVSPWGQITVMGRVMKPGSIPLPANRHLTMSEAIASVGGLATSARDRAVQLTRKAADGAATTRTVNLRAILAGGKSEEDVVLLPGDIIFVPESIF